MAGEKLTIIMLQRVAWIGKEWEIVEVSHSQVRNYLIPKWLARLVTQAEIQKIEKKKTEQIKNTRENVFNRHKIAELLHMKEIILEAKWNADKIFGGIQELDIVNLIEKEKWIKLEKKNIVLPEWHHIKKAWKYDIKLNLWSDVFARISLDVKVIK